MFALHENLVVTQALDGRLNLRLCCWHWGWRCCTALGAERGSGSSEECGDRSHRLWRGRGLRRQETRVGG